MVAITNSLFLQEVLVRFVSLGSEEDEWVNIRKAVRERSVTLEHSECNKVKVGDLVLCFQVPFPLEFLFPILLQGKHRNI